MYTSPAEVGSCNAPSDPYTCPSHPVAHLRDLPSTSTPLPPPLFISPLSPSVSLQSHFLLNLLKKKKKKKQPLHDLQLIPEQ